jgi:hypothetical protein
VRQITVARLDNQLTTDADAMDDDNGTNEGDVRGADKDRAGGTEEIQGGGGHVSHAERDNGRGGNVVRNNDGYGIDVGGAPSQPSPTTWRTTTSSGGITTMTGGGTTTRGRRRCRCRRPTSIRLPPAQSDARDGSGRPPAGDGAMTTKTLTMTTTTEGCKREGIAREGMTRGGGDRRCIVDLRRQRVCINIHINNDK